jgi:hypothetical protein
VKSTVSREQSAISKVQSVCIKSKSVSDLLTTRGSEMIYREVLKIRVKLRRRLVLIWRIRYQIFRESLKE